MNGWNEAAPPSVVGVDELDAQVSARHAARMRQAMAAQEAAWARDRALMDADLHGYRREAFVPAKGVPAGYVQAQAAGAGVPDEDGSMRLQFQLADGTKLRLLLDPVSVVGLRLICDPAGGLRMPANLFGCH